MRIAFLTSEFVTEPSFAGGLAQYLGRVTPALVERGHHVEVFVAAESNSELDYKGVIVHRIRPQGWLPLRGVNWLLRHVRRPQLTETSRACNIAKGLNDALRQRSLKDRFDVVQATSWFATGFFAAKNPPAPVVVRVSSYEPLLTRERNCRLTVDRRLYSLIELATMRRAAAVYTPSKFLAGEILKRTGIKAEVLKPPFYQTTDSGEDTSAVDKLADWPRYLLYFGRVCRYKGSALLADAIRPLLQKVPGLCLAVAGPASDGDIAAERLLRLAKTYPDSVRYLGVLSQDELMTVIKKAWAVVLPSLMDNLPNTCIEAMGLGQVVIGPRGVSFDELVNDGESGILFQLGDPVSLRQAIVHAWNLCEAERDQISQAAKNRIAQMTPEITLQKLENLYEALASPADDRNSILIPEEAIIKYG